ncbi:CPBP family intramembrane metalloprotease [Rhodococcus sp. BP-316]|uniref:CPBP family intramembrane glutamic endopeptidase n=1 Tax=unclassified Rhodococcus (in: high G+C Gram-positive bacteria) TaxID=192944 RepID=UPI000690A6D7|nr:CAAX protease [Rhodococcus sp. Leaf225]KQU48366.1 CAAX protease [Rhodococcus sp. Leaf258]MBY6677458.1 CPBP family intramembrane metalloprotease [Rhodococcus sp. BP-332]MBY6683535.1 CPBP family intramembrane metalloprotease [Rhodococcus sp. BP-316]
MDRVHPEKTPTTESPRSIRIEIVVVLLFTFGLSGLSSILSLVESALEQGALSDQTVAINVPQSTLGPIDFLRQLIGVVRLCAWGALGLYLLWRSGIGPRAIGFARPRLRPHVLHGVGLAAIIGIPGLLFYLVAVALDLNVTVLPSTLNDVWWRPITLTLSAVANSVAEEVLVVAWLISRLRALGWTDNRSLLASAVLRGSYHLYQGFGAGVGNLVMGLIFGRYFQRTGRLWPLVIAHALIDIVAFVGFAALRDHVSWLPG